MLYEVITNYGEQKSARLRDFEPILKLPSIRFVDLQYGDTLEERTALKESTGVEVSHLDDVDNYQDIDGLAALITACDAVVTVSNTTVHIAGALGTKATKCIGCLRCVEACKIENDVVMKDAHHFRT